jgi:bacillolysin
MFASATRVALLGLLVFVTGLLPASAAQAAPGVRAFRALTADEATAFRVPADVLLTSRGVAGRDKLAFERYQQRFGDADVLGGQLTIYRAADGTTLAVIGAHYPAINATNTASLNAGEARAIVQRLIGAAGEWRSRLLIDPANGRYFLEVENRRDDSRWFHWIDAETGAVVNAYDGLAYDLPQFNEGVGVLGDVKDLTGLTTPSGSGGYELVSEQEQSSGKVRQRTYDAQNNNSPRALPGALATDGDNIWDTAGAASPGQPALVDAQFYARVTDVYFDSVHGFDWLSHYSQGMVSSAHVKRGYNNAYWNGTQMAYGDGDGVNFREFSGDLDVVGHELSHGVTEATSNLIYQNESGALNEAFSDIMGTAIEFAGGQGNWTIGEDVGIDSGAYKDGIRDMSDPTVHGDPSHYADRYTGTSDNGGVHINSGIANHWFYLLVNGGQNAKDSRASGTAVVGIGLTAAEQVAFKGFTALTANADFCAARASTIALAGGYATNVGDAWDEVGVDSALCTSGSVGGGGGTSTGPAPVISNVSAKSAKGTKFVISWDTNLPADSEVSFTCCGVYSDSQLVTNHSMQFTGSRGVTYHYTVSSTANGVKSTSATYIYQN